MRRIRATYAAQWASPAPPGGNTTTCSLRSPTTSASPATMGTTHIRVRGRPAGRQGLRCPPPIPAHSPTHIRVRPAISVTHKRGRDGGRHRTHIRVRLGSSPAHIRGRGSRPCPMIKWPFSGPRIFGCGQRKSDRLPAWASRAPTHIRGRNHAYLGAKTMKGAHIRGRSGRICGGGFHA